jgi:thymidine kinase
MKKLKISTMGRLTVVTGPMFSGKTGKLITMTEVLTGIGKVVVVIKPSIDSRYGKKAELHSHDHRTIKSLLVDPELTPQDILKKVLETKPTVVIVDEAQFFTASTILPVVEKLRNMNIDVIASGLQYDFRRRPFGAMPDLIGIADDTIYLVAVCQKCGRVARHSERVAGGESQVAVGSRDSYIAACDQCHHIYGYNG